jgi:hypothetical protein
VALLAAGAGTGNGAASGEDHDVGQFGLGFRLLLPEGGWQEQQGLSARYQGVESRFHYFLSSSETVLMQVHLAGSSRVQARGRIRTSATLLQGDV